MNKEILKKYARLAVRTGVNVQPGQLLVIRASVKDSEFIEYCVEEAYKAGARNWEDLQAKTKIGTVCGGCKQKALEKLHEFEHLYG